MYVFYNMHCHFLQYAPNMHCHFFFQYALNMHFHFLQYAPNMHSHFLQYALSLMYVSNHVYYYTYHDNHIHSYYDNIIHSYYNHTWSWLHFNYNSMSTANFWLELYKTNFDCCHEAKRVFCSIVRLGEVKCLIVLA